MTPAERAEQIATAALLEVYGCTNMEFLIHNSNEAAKEDVQIIAKHIKRALKQADSRLQLAVEGLKKVGTGMCPLYVSKDAAASMACTYYCIAGDTLKKLGVK